MGMPAAKCRCYGAHPGVGDDDGDVGNRLMGDVPAYRRWRGRRPAPGQDSPSVSSTRTGMAPSASRNQGSIGLPVQGGAEAEQDPRVPGFREAPGEPTV